MTQVLPPTEPLDENERELARIVRALPGGEPPPALDARILKAAANAAAGSRRPHSRWLASSGALWGIGSAAAAVLAVGVSWHSMFPSSASSGARSNPVAISPESAQDSTISVELKDRPAREYDNAPPPAPADLGRALAANAPAAAPPAPAVMAAAPASQSLPEPFATDHIDEHVPSRATGGATALASAPEVSSPAEKVQDQAIAESSAMAAKAAPAQSRREADAASLSNEARSDQSAGMLAQAAKPLRLKPSNWLAQIRQLRDQNQHAEARASLIAFHKRYPDLVIPSDLAPLLRQ